MCVCVVDCLHDVKSISQRERVFFYVLTIPTSNFLLSRKKKKKCGAARFFFFFFALWGIRNEKFIIYFFLSTTQIDASGGRMREILKTTTTKQKAEAKKKKEKKIQAPDSRHRSVGGRGTPAVFNLVTALARSFPAAPACCLVGSSKSY